MTTQFNTGIILLDSPELNHDDSDISHLKDFLQKMQGVTAVWNVDIIKVKTKIDKITEEIKEKKINRILLAGYQIGFLKTWLRLNITKKINESVIITLVDFSVAQMNNKLEFLKSILISSLYEISVNSIYNQNIVQKETLVIGGGIAGIQAALEIADSKNKVYLVEKSGTIGGHMAMFDKTFPTLDCAACILTPKMVEAGQHPYIELLTYCEVQSVSGIPGNYKVNILKKARRVNLKTCIGCGTCAEKCPGSAPSEFDVGTTMRKAIYIPFPQAVPNKYLIDAESCRYVKTGKCGVCIKICPVENCINLDEKDEVITINVGNIIVATGYQIFDAKKIQQFGYGLYPNVVTSLELERLVNASGPTEGQIKTRTQDKKGNWIFSTDGKTPKNIALIHCVGSRDENYNKYCSRVCCMYSLKLAHLIKEKIPDAGVDEYYIDIRTFGKGYEEFYNRIKEEGINLIRGRTAKISGANDKLLLRSEDILNQKIIERQYDMAVLAVGLEPHPETSELAGFLGLNLSLDGWVKENDNLTNSTGTLKGGIYLAGTCQGPKDIPDTVSQASAAASMVIKNIMNNIVNQNTDELTVKDILEESKISSLLYENEL